MDYRFLALLITHSIFFPKDWTRLVSRNAGIYLLLPQVRERSAIALLGRQVFGGDESSKATRNLLSSAFNVLCSKTFKTSAEQGRKQKYLVLDLRPNVAREIRVRESVDISQDPLVTYQIVNGRVSQVTYPAGANG